MNLKFRDLKPNSYYYTEYGGRYILYTTDNIGIAQYIMLNDNYYNTVGGFSYVGPFREATKREIQHLDACIKAGKWVDAPKRIVIPQLID